MAPVSSIDNQLPLLQTNSEKSTGAENDAIMPFGHWLQQKSDAKNEPQSKSVKPKNEEQAHELKPDEDPKNRDAQNSTKLFADNVTEKEKKPVKLFKDQPTVSPKSKDKAAAANKSVEADLTRTAKNSKPGVSDNTATTTGVAKTDHIKGVPQRNGVNGIAQALEPKTGTQAGIPKTGTQAVELKTATKVVIPKTVTQAVEAKTEAKAVETKTVAQASASGQNLKLSLPDPSVQNNANLNNQGPNAAESLLQLKTNVKAIFNSLTPLKSTALKDTPVFRHNSASGSNGRTLSIDKVKPIRLTTMPAEQSSIRQQTGKTTLQHLETRKSTRLDTELKPGKLTSANNLIRTGADSRTDKKKEASLKARKEARAVQAKTGHKNYGHHSVPPDGAQSISKDIDATRDGILLQAASNRSGQADFIQSDGASADSNQNHLLGKEQANLNASMEKSTGKAPATYASRSSAWVKTLSERTTQLNQQDPNWKKLEMRLDDGDGNMTIKVMRENEHVTVSVQFTDDALRAHAESQTSQIMDSLKEQYGKDVTFNFANKQESASDSSLRDQAARRRRLNSAINQVEKPVPAPRYDPLSPDQHVWIG